MKRADSFDGPTLKMGGACDDGPFEEAETQHADVGAPSGSAAACTAEVGPDDSLLDLLGDTGAFVSSFTGSGGATASSAAIAASCGGSSAAGTVDATESVTSAVAAAGPSAASTATADLPWPVPAPLSATDGLSSDSTAPADPLPPVPPPVAPSRPPLMKRAETQDFDLDAAEDSAGDSHDAPAITEPASVLTTTNSATAADVKLDSACISVGRGEGVTVLLNDPRVSSQQFVVRRSPMPGASAWSYNLEDHSRNGTLVNKRLVKGSIVELKDNDLIEVLPTAKVGRADAIAFLFKRPSPLPAPKSDVESSASTKMPATASEEPAAKRARLEASGSVSDLFEGALCTICQEVLHRATSVQPCLHSFCSSCLGRWLKRPDHKFCPLCRHAATGVTRNYTLDGLIDGLLKAHPSKGRSAAELAELDAHDLLKDAGYDLARLLGGGPRGAPLFGAAATPVFGTAAGLDGTFGFAASSDSEEEDEESEDDEEEGSFAGPPCFHCGAGGGQRLADIAAALAASALDAARLVRAGVLGNEFESGVLEEWLTASDGRTLASALAGLLANPNPAGAPPVHSVRFQRAGIGSSGGGLPDGSWTEIIACRSCAISVLKEVIYSLRERISESELHERARGRAVCWYGRACRTQVHNSTHAQRLNHICDQTRFR